MRSSIIRSIILLLLAAVVAGCDTGFRQMNTSEFGVRFRRLPRVVGGGIGATPILPGQMSVVWPWETIYRFDTAVKSVSWGDQGKGDDASRADYVHTRASDGNEVALGVTVRYRVKPEPEALRFLVQNVATDDEGVRQLVTTVARADIRSRMNRLRTSAFLDPNERYKAVREVQESMISKLGHYGISVESVNLDEFRFERQKEDGTIDASYQDRLKEIQRLKQDTERENSRIKTVEAKKQQELNEAQGEVNRRIAEADGYKKQAEYRGGSYFEAKKNEADSILAKGKAEVEGVQQRVNALQGPGGRAILKLEVAKALMKNDPKFMVLSEGSQGGIRVEKSDINELIGQLGVIEGMKDKPQVRAEKTDKQN